jgi:creatinine amidohydrolase
LPTDTTPTGAYLGDLTWVDAERALASSTVIVAFAAGAKQHGPHLPLNTDQVVMEHLLAAAVQTRPVLVCPPILHGWFPAFRNFPGTEVADPGAFQAYVAAVAQSLAKHGAKRLVFLNLGLSSTSGLPLGVVARELRANEQIDTLLVSWDDLETPDAQSHYEQQRGGHADEGETAIMLHLRPDLVRMEQAKAEYRATPTPQIGQRPGVFDRHSESGTFGDPTLATAQKGEAILSIMRRNWLTALDQFTQSVATDN